MEFKPIWAPVCIQKFSASKQRLCWGTVGSAYTLKMEQGMIQMGDYLSSRKEYGYSVLGEWSPRSFANTVSEWETVRF